MAGNQTAIGGFTYSYDAENRVSVVTEPSPTTPPSYRYVYDGEGRRVQKIASGGPTTSYAYDASGNLAAEYTSGTTASLSCATCYLVQDTLGSTRLVLDATTGSLAALHDYLPFGEELVSGARPGSLYAGNDNPRQKFTGKERDAESGLDFFGARYFSGAQGRFTSTGAPFNDQDANDPQSWNLYGYVRNSRPRYTGPAGRECAVPGSGAWLLRKLLNGVALKHYGIARRCAAEGRPAALYVASWTTGAGESPCASMNASPEGRANVRNPLEPERDSGVIPNSIPG